MNPASLACGAGWQQCQCVGSPGRLLVALSGAAQQARASAPHFHQRQPRSIIPRVFLPLAFNRSAMAAAMCIGCVRAPLAQRPTRRFAQPTVCVARPQTSSVTPRAAKKEVQLNSLAPSEFYHPHRLIVSVGTEHAKSFAIASANGCRRASALCNLLPVPPPLLPQPWISRATRQFPCHPSSLRACPFPCHILHSFRTWCSGRPGCHQPAGRLPARAGRLLCHAGPAQLAHQVGEYRRRLAKRITSAASSAKLMRRSARRPAPATL